MLPLFNEAMGTEVSLNLSWSVVLYVLFGIVGIGCVAGSYPAFYLSSVNPLIAFKGGKKTGKKGGMLKGLICVQFIITITLMLATMLVYKQLYFMQNKDFGLNKENVVTVYTNLWYNVNDFRQEILKNPNVQSVAMGSTIENL